MDKINDNILRDSLKQTKIQASDNLKYRIMQQVQTEAMLKSKVKKRPSFSIVKSFVTTLATAYLLIGALWIYIYRIAEPAPNNDSMFYISVMSISGLCFIFWAICMWDNIRVLRGAGKQ